MIYLKNMGIGDMFKNVFSSANSSVLGIDIGSSAIKIVQLKKQDGKAVLETYGELALGPYSKLEVGQASHLSMIQTVEAMNDLLNEKEVAVTTKDCGVAIPVLSSFMAFIEMPEASDKDLQNMIPIEARKYIPIPIAEVTLSWSIIPKDKVKSGEVDIEEKSGEKTAKKIDVLVIAIHNDVVSKYRDILDKTGLEASFLEIEAFSTIRAVVENHDKPQMIIDFGASTTKVYMVERGILKISHTINRGSQDITTALAKSMNISIKRAEVLKRTRGLSGGTLSEDYTEETRAQFIEASSTVIDYIFSEAKRVLATFRRGEGKNVERVVLSGGGSILDGFKELAEKSFETEVKYADPFSKVDAPAFLVDVLSESGPEFAVALGLALRKLEELG